MLDRIIPIISPFFDYYAGEIHHKPRYKKYPSLLGIGIQNYTSSEETECFKNIIYRNSLNLHSPTSNALTFMINDAEASIQLKINEIIVSIENSIYDKQNSHSACL